MKYTYENQKKALNYLIKNFPHDMEKFKKLYEIETENDMKVKIRISDILFSSVWNVEEKIQLLKLYEHDKDPKFYKKTVDREIGYSVGMEGLPLIDQCIREQNYSGVEALLSLGAHISVATIMRIIEYIKDPNERYKFCELLVNHYKDKENIKAYEGTGIQCKLTTIPTLCDRYPIYSRYFEKKELWRTYSSMEDICETNDLELVKLFLPTIKNINPLLMFAIKSKNTEMVQLFIDAGADVNFQDLEFIRDNGMVIFKTPLKIAIDNNDLEMIKFLYQNGADLNYVDKSERMQEFINSLGKDEIEKKTHQYAYDWETRAYTCWTKTPLEYALNIEPTSFLYNQLSIEKELKKVTGIVKYLYDNGARFGDQQINFTDLICFSIKFDDVESTKYYFEEALKNNAKLDFVKIINFIHIPGLLKKDYMNTIHYKFFEEGAKPWLNLCYEYSKKLDNENHTINVKLMLEKIFEKFTFNSSQFDVYKEIIKKFSKILPEKTLKEIPAVFGVCFKNLEETLDLGYDIKCLDEKGNSIIMNYLLNRNIGIETLEKLISLGADINYNNGNSALSIAIDKLTTYDFSEYIHNFNKNTGQLYLPTEEYEKEKKSLVKKIIEISSDDIIMSDTVKQNVCHIIKPGYSQIIYNEILDALSKRGFKVEDDYFYKSITFLDEPYSMEYITNPWEYLWNLYNNFDNCSIDTKQKFPKVENVKLYKYGTDENNNLFKLIVEHLNRNFSTKIEQIKEPNKVVDSYYNNITNTCDKLNCLQVAQNKLLTEISRYIGNLDYRQIIYLINNYPIIDNESIVRNDILLKAMDTRDIELCRELVKMGISIVCYDKNGHDITSTIYSDEQINLFKSLNNEYNPNKECEDLLAQLGCGQKVLSKIKKEN